ncbi:hypothetical protein PCURB6_13640 [Paenibacillus curdlanolyticus]|nr:MULTISPECIES: LacI family DNA-binding transcriptional regulator [Paenibacillus]GFN31104.1 hypothetical protein PCURB6_13640 [Paenibacillus curdlanolyticus]
MREKATIQQIADFAGLSKFAVSRALAGKSGVSEATKERILKAAGQLGYFRTKAAGRPEQLNDPEAVKGYGRCAVPKYPVSEPGIQLLGTGVRRHLHEAELEEYGYRDADEACQSGIQKVSVRRRYRVCPQLL